MLTSILDSTDASALDPGIAVEHLVGPDDVRHRGLLRALPVIMQNPIQARGFRSLGLIVVGALSLAVVAGMTLTHAAIPDAVMWGWHDGMWTGGHMAGWGGWSWGMMLFGLLWMALLVALPISLVYWLATGSQSDSSAEDSALAVLQERYARGEIDDEEFDRRRARLASDNDRS